MRTSKWPQPRLNETTLMRQGSGACAACVKPVLEGESVAQGAILWGPILLGKVVQGANPREANPEKSTFLRVTTRGPPGRSASAKTGMGRS